MPIFEYLCRDCGREFETFVTGERKAACPECQGANLGKLLSRPGMVGAGDRSASASSPAPSFGGCGAGGASCACRTPAN
jgi:putative FmdB family regulatory protein